MNPRPREPASVMWKLRLRSGVHAVYELLSTAEGRASFWAEAAPERNGVIHFLFPNGERLEAEILERVPGRRFSIRYFEGSLVVFDLEERPEGGSIVTLRETGLPAEARPENAPGWVSVLLNLKAVADFGVDLRNHAPGFTWAEGFVDN